MHLHPPRRGASAQATAALDAPDGAASARWRSERSVAHVQAGGVCEEVLDEALSPELN